ELAIEFVASDAAEVIAATIEEHVLDERTRIINGGRIAGAHFLIKFEQGLVLTFDRVAIQRGLNVAHVGVGVDAAESVEDALVGREIELLAKPLLFRQGTDGAQQSSNRQLALAVDFDGEQVFVAGFEFEPGAAARYELGGIESAASGGVLVGGEV